MLVLAPRKTSFTNDSLRSASKTGHDTSPIQTIENELDGASLSVMPDHSSTPPDGAPLDSVDLTQLRSEVGPSPDRLDVERWLLDIELAIGVSRKFGDNDSYLNWYQPEAVVMLLLPTTIPWQSGAFVGGFEWGSPHTDLRTALLHRWHGRHGAELGANWGTMLQFVVRHPPATIEEAWAVAYEVSLIWPDTAGGTSGVATRRHARDLVGRHDWFLHYRP